MISTLERGHGHNFHNLNLSELKSPYLGWISRKSHPQKQTPRIAFGMPRLRYSGQMAQSLKSESQSCTKNNIFGIKFNQNESNNKTIQSPLPFEARNFSIHLP